MAELADAHLDTLALRMGRHLRGFDDPAVHVGTPERFVREFRKVLDLPALRVPAGDLKGGASLKGGAHSAWSADSGQASSAPTDEGFAGGARSAWSADSGQASSAPTDPLASSAPTDVSGQARVSYAEAVVAWRAPTLNVESDDPVSVLMRGLGGPMTLATGTRGELPADTLREDLAGLLRQPVLTFYLLLSDRGRFLAAIGQIATERGVQVATGAADPGTAETIVALPMVSAVKATISYDLLREAVALELVQSYQEETPIRAIDCPGGAA
jgi:hypothetical protein